MSWSTPQKYLAEFLGTLALLFLAGGTAVFTLGEPDLARVILVSLAFGLVLTALAYAFGEISGGHFNPAVTLSMALSRRMPMMDVVPYLVAQIAGGLVGIGLVAGIAHGSDPLWSLAQGGALGSQTYSGNGAPGSFSLGSVFLLEVVMTFLFVLVIQLITRPENGAKNLAPVGIGFTLLVGNLLAIPVDGASLNPVRSFSPALLSYASWGTTWAIDQSWLFWVAPIIGGLLAAVVEMALRPRP
jgi:aquaporin Z